MRLIHERSETTLPWSTACDSGTTPRIHYSVNEMEKYHQSSHILLKTHLQLLSCQMQL